MDGDVAGTGIILQGFQDLPTADVGEVKVQGNGFRLIALDQFQPTFTLAGDEAFEPFVM